MLLHPDAPFVVDNCDGRTREAARVLGRCWSQFGAGQLRRAYFVPPSPHTSAVLVPSSDATRSHTLQGQGEIRLAGLPQSSETRELVMSNV